MRFVACFGDGQTLGTPYLNVAKALGRIGIFAAGFEFYAALGERRGFKPLHQYSWASMMVRTRQVWVKSLVSSDPNCKSPS